VIPTWCNTDIFVPAEAVIIEPHLRRSAGIIDDKSVLHPLPLRPGPWGRDSEDGRRVKTKRPDLIESGRPGQIDPKSLLVPPSDCKRAFCGSGIVLGITQET